VGHERSDIGKSRQLRAYSSYIVPYGRVILLSPKVFFDLSDFCLVKDVNVDLSGLFFDAGLSFEEDEEG
jgi:hypothetical protein